MTTEILMLLGAVGVLFAVSLAQTAHFILVIGIPAAVSNRDADQFPTQLDGFGGRVKRTLRNHVEGLALAAPLILAGAVSGISNEMTVLGAQIFLAGRIAHALLYLIGVPWVRTAAFVVGLIGLAYVVYGLFFVV